jgi:hypothetical protein
MGPLCRSIDVDSPKMALAHKKITAPKDMIRKQLTSKEFWIPGSPELNPCDKYL